ncbi:MAG TPA: thiamine phosphate synthase, partial [Alphaproteobacteria bacterium]|nr:thiamine phosphate synthase [Alphaproteobacteria bacterium]
VKDKLLPRINLLTPNLEEAEKLSGIKIQSENDIRNAALKILDLGVRAVIIKGFQHNGHAYDYYQASGQNFFLTSPLRTTADARGTGCSFASICASAHALGMTDADAVVLAKAKINQAVRLAQNIGQGMRILTYEKSPPIPEDLPWLAQSIDFRRPEFPDCGKDLGFYPIVDSVAWLERLLPLGVRTAQLRIKNKSGSKLENEIAAAITLGKKYNCRLFINDYWQLAIKYQAYGVHLGQEDLADANMNTIAQAGLRLGLSTHSYEELARAHACRPSYIALGPIYHTTLKVMPFPPQGLQTLADWRRMLDYPLVAIGGITLERATEVMAAGADSIAVVSDITQNENPEDRARCWLKLFAQQKIEETKAA